MNENSYITKKMIDQILYNMPMLRVYAEELEPSSSASIVTFTKGTRNSTSTVEKIAVKRAIISSILKATEKGIKALHPEQRKVYRMRYRAHMTYKQIARRLYISEETVGRRLGEIRAVIKEYLQQVPQSDLKEFMRFLRSKT